MVAHELSGHLATINWKQLAVALAIPLVGGIGGSLATANQINTWYRGINKPSWTPPNWLFGPVWTALYAMMGLASYLVWRQGGFERQAVPLAVYGVQLVLNLLWTPLFFKAHRLDLASADIAGMLVAIVATICQLRRVIGDLALMLLLPYLAWVSYASALTFWIWRHNPTRSTRVKAY
eukprot:GHUV01031125.1.p1 GENE.GHUV01031125.1~~GHUV01031125.1.p1  ORF type:complete len:178 (+),score=28.09 GHUV01031125.1:82-615(+)